MIFFELEPSDISNLSDADLREMVARLCEAELIGQELQPSCVLWVVRKKLPMVALMFELLMQSRYQSPDL